jgi:hypothetical protein
VSTIRHVTEHHGQQYYEYQQEERLEIPQTQGCAVQMGEIDGSMIPMVRINEAVADKRKGKTLEWKEARLAITHELGCVTAKFGVVFQGDVNDAGQALLDSAILSGFGQQTHLYSVGDGAKWIADQVSKKCGKQGRYLVDFYHVCEYLSEASKICAVGDEKAGMSRQKKDLKQNDFQKVIGCLKPYLEDISVDNDKAPVRACHRYLSNRVTQLDHKSAIEKGLPIGSGEVESAHRYVIQKRLKISGAWWKGDNADYMLALRVMRANDEWGAYWKTAA